MDSSTEYRNGLFTEMFAVTMTHKDGKQTSDIVNAQSERDAMRKVLQDLRDLSQITNIEAAAV